MRREKTKITKERIRRKKRNRTRRRRRRRRRKFRQIERSSQEKEEGVRGRGGKDIKAESKFSGKELEKGEEKNQKRVQCVSGLEMGIETMMVAVMVVHKGSLSEQARACSHRAHSFKSRIPGSLARTDTAFRGAESSRAVQLINQPSVQCRVN